MGRTFTNEARRAQIMAAAITTIAELGYAKASFARITGAAGLSSPRMISYHFTDKDGLIHEILRHVYVTGAAFIAERVAAATTATDRLTAYLQANLQFIQEHPAEMIALNEIGPHVRTPADRPYTSVSAQEPGVVSLEKLLGQGQTDGAFRDFDTRSMAVIIRGAVDRAAERLREEPDFDFDTYAREVVTTFAIATRAVAR
jgi:AcrR family transcriptional regulator